MTKDAYGQEVETFTLTATRWGSVEITGNMKGENYEGQQATTSIEITMRATDQVTMLGVVGFSTGFYSVTQIIDVGGLGVEYIVSAEKLTK